MQPHATRFIRFLLLVAGLALAGPAAAGRPPISQAAKKVHGNTRLGPGNALIRVGEARAAVKGAVDLQAGQLGGSKARKLRNEDITIDASTGTWTATVKQKRSGKTLHQFTGSIDLQAPTRAQIAPVARSIYDQRKDATPETDWQAAQAKLRKQGIAQPTDEQTRPMANKLSRQRTQLGDWQQAERQLRRSSDRVQVTGN